MTKRFKKVKDFEALSFMQSIERELIEDSEGDIFTVHGLEQARDDDAISDAEEGFMSGYLEAGSY